MNCYIPLIGTTMLGVALVTGCATSNHNTIANHTASRSTTVQSQTAKTKTTNTAYIKKSTPTGTNIHVLPSKPDKYTAPPEWITNQLVYVIGWNKQINPTHALFVSHNAGQAWTQLSTPLGGDIQQVHFQTPTTGIVYGASGEQFNHLAMYHTTDGGAHWTRESLPATLTQGVSKYGAPQVGFSYNNGKLTWLFATWNDTQFPKWGFYHISPNAQSWKISNVSIGSMSSGEAVVVHALNTQTAYFVKYCSKCATGNTRGKNTLEITHDAGRTWTKIALPFTGENHVQQLVFADNKHGTATVENMSNSQVTKYVTTDGGHHWAKQ